MAIDVETLYDRRADNRWDRMSVGDIFERMTHSDPDKVAIVATPDAVVDPRYAQLTYREADRLANRVVNALIGGGLQRGDRVAMLCENSPEAYVTKIAIAKAGMVAFPINTLMADDMVEHMQRLTEARVAIVDHDAWDPKGGPLRACGITPLATLGPAGTAPDGIPDLETWLTGASQDEPSVRIHGDDIWEIISTSGTTALP
jgi:acyl-CoA synthetase (AMP-forming)/AMP-acid ligase II